MRTLILLLTLGLLALIVAPATALAADDRPMHGRFGLTMTAVTADCGPGNVRLTFSAAGNVTHLGRVTGTATNCTPASLGVGAVPIFDGVATWVAPDGSTLTTHYEGTQAAPIAGVAAVDTTHTVVAGTGRFAGASGSWTTPGAVDFTTGTFRGTLSGSIDY